MYLQFFRVCLWGALFVAAGCGGGTSGTGTGDDPAITIRTYNGTVRSSKDLKPLKNIQVTLENTGDSALTNEAGEFEIVALALPAQLKFLLEGEGVASEVMVDSVEPDAQKVTLALDVGAPGNAIEVRSISGNAGIEGACDPFFENRDYIRQAARVPEGTKCTIRVKLFGDGDLLGQFPVALQRRLCDPSAGWVTIQAGATRSDKYRGIAEFNFPYVDSEVACYYRIIAPYLASGGPQVRFLLKTFTAQEYESRNLR